MRRSFKIFWLFLFILSLFALPALGRLGAWQEDGVSLVRHSPESGPVPTASLPPARTDSPEAAPVVAGY